MASVLKNFCRRPQISNDFMYQSSWHRRLLFLIADGSKNKKFKHGFIREICRQNRKSLCAGKVNSNVKFKPPQRCLSTNVEVTTEKKTLDPYSLVEDEISRIPKLIKQELVTLNPELQSTAEYYFDGQGKFFRPMLVMLVAKALNFHLTNEDRLLPSQQKIAMIAEMIHTASLMHDDVIDAADTRRGKPSINQVWGQRKSIIAGDFVMAMASISLAKIRDETVVSVVAQITEDLVKGEFMQMGSKENQDERFAHYINKSYKKTASLLANSCKAVAILGNCGDSIADIAYEYGKNIGISFQLIDDLLDFTSCDDVMGKPTAADLKLGLATAPVLFAARKYPQLNALIMRRFSQDGDVQLAREYVAKSNGVTETRELAQKHSDEAVEQIKYLNKSDSLKALETVAKLVLSRNK
ncbi:Decaprenyl-diphosphate synthase subunit 1 [Mactra antiquata]